MSTKIEWTDETWNPITGCTRVSEGCRNCYAERLAATRLKNSPRYQGVAEMTDAGPRWTGKVRLHPELLEQPLRWRKPRRIFVCSQSDLFHEDVPDKFIDRTFAVMALSKEHVFQCLTKRPERMAAYIQGRDWGDAANWATDRFVRRLDGPLHLIGEIVPPLPNVWLGVSVENQATADERIPLLLQTPAAVRFVSCEPLLGAVDLAAVDYPDAQGLLDWAIVGGESGPGARPMHPDWARSLRDQCQVAGVPYFFKQWGEWLSIDQMNDTQLEVLDLDRLHDLGRVDIDTHPLVTQCRVGKKAAGRELDGREWNEMPEAAR